MKLQYLTVIFIIIFLPIILVTTFYVQQQMKTINIQLEYDAALLDATHDAMVAFEINTANEDLSSVSDSLRSIIEASNNIFLNTLAINFGISNANKSFVQPYIPAILYSLYDGYYIYSPTYSPIVCTDKYGQTISTDSIGVKYKGTKTYSGKTFGIYEFDQSSITYGTGTVTPTSGPKVTYSSLPNDIKSEYGQILYENEDGTYSTVIHTVPGASITYNTKYKISYILKSYVPYAATYSHNDSDDTKDVDITINYTLDNYMSIMGDIGGIYYSKSGYLINRNLINTITINGNTINWYTYSDEELEKKCQDPKNNEVIVTFRPDKNGNTIILSNRDNNTISGGETIYWQDAKDATAYYCKAWAFSEWIYTTDALMNLTEANVVSSVYDIVNNNLNTTYASVDKDNLSEKLLYDFETSTNTIFYNIDPTDADYDSVKADPENKQSTFVEHKRHVIRNSITYNLSLAMTAYNEKYYGMTFEMPILQEEEWDKILSNVSILTFMQGLNCGHKIYNNYALVSSNNNEISVTPEEIYYTYYTESLEDGIDLNGDGVIDGVVETVHRLNCPKLNDNPYYTSIKSKEIKYDKNYNSVTSIYDYDHKVYTCYDCIVNSNYTGINKNKNTSEGILDSIYPNSVSGTFPYTNKLKAYYIAVGKERYNLYKPTAAAESNAIEIINIDPPVSGYNVNGSVTLDIPDSTYAINRIAKIDLTFEDTCVDAGTLNLYTTSLKISLNGSSSMSYNQVIIPVTSTTTRTIELSGSFASTSKLERIKFELGSSAVNFNVRSIKIYYK